MTIQQRLTKFASPVLAVALCLTPELSAGQQNSNSQPNSSPQTQQGSGTTVDPSKAPLQPVTTYPDAPTPRQDQSQGAQTPQTTTTTAPAPQTQRPPSEPVGAAAAERVPTAGGAAAKPAGAAIAPAKQHQTRSLLIKVGAVAAGALAAGSVYALSHATPSKPPGTGLPGATQK